MKKYLYYILQFTWGLPANILGVIGVLFCKLILQWDIIKYNKNFIISPKKDNFKSGLSLGIFLFMDKNSSQYFKAHEYGHSIQNIIFGPLFLFVIGLPSFIRCMYFNLIINKIPIENNSYYDIWFEKDANSIGQCAVIKKIWKWLI